MSQQTAEILTQKKAPEFRGSLVRTVVIGLVIIALFPAAIITAISYFRFRSILQTQTINQMSSLSQSYSQQIEQAAAANEYSLIAFSGSPTITDAVLKAQFSPNYFLNDNSITTYVKTFVGTLSSQDVFALFAVDQSGNVLFSSSSKQVGTSISQDKQIQALVGTTHSALVFNPDNLYPNQMVLVTAYPRTIPGTTTPVTFIAYAKPTLLTTLLTSPLSYFSSAHVYYLTADNQFITLNPDTQIPEVSTAPANLQTTLIQLAASAAGGKSFTYNNFSGKSVYSYIRPIPALSSSYLLEVPVASVQGELQTLIRFVLILLAAAILVSALASFIGARQIAVPLVDLSDKARKFANGDFTQKAAVTRNDEIGLLASSFNYMVDQLSAFYTSLESRVAERTGQMRTSSEIAMDAVSAANTNAILRRVTQSIVEKLGYSYSAAYLADASMSNLVLTEDFSSSADPMPERNLRLVLDETSLIGWAGANRQARISQDVHSEHPQLLPAPLLPSTTSEVAFPILIGDRLIGVLDIQSPRGGVFDADSLPAFTALANQIAAGLRNIETLETTQLNLQETAVLYAATHDIAQAQNEGEVFQQIANLFTKTDYAAFFLDVIGKEIHLVNIADPKPSPADSSLLGAAIPFESALKELASGEMRVNDNFQLLTGFSPLNAYFGRRGCTSDAIFPVFEGSELKHLLAVGSRAEKPLTPLQLQPYQSFAEAVGSALERIHLNESLNQKYRDIQLLSEIQANSDSNVNLTDLFADIHNKIKAVYGNDLGFCVAFSNAEKNQISLPYFNSDQGTAAVAPYPLSSDLISQTIKTGTDLTVEDASLKGLLAVESPDRHLSVRSWLGIPMYAGNRVMGVMAIFMTARAGAFAVDTKTIFNLIASRLALAINIQNQTQKLEETQSKLTLEKTLFDALLDNTPEEVAIKNSNNEFMRLSKSMAQFLGSSNPADLIGKVDDFGYYPEGKESVNATVTEVISSQTPLRDQTEKWVTRDGNPRWMISNKIPLLNTEGSVSGLLSISRDITDLVKTRQLAETREEQLLTASEIARESTAGTMDVEVTLARLVELIKTRFNFYHASVFLLDALGKFAVLRESTGEAGAQMKQTGHKLAVGSPSIVGQATGQGTPVVIGDVTKEVNYFANPLLPDTRSELAIPMKIGDRVLGALDVQATELNAFSPEDINILQVLANQTAVAIQNENLFTRTSEDLSRHRLLHRVTSSNVETMTIEDSIRSTLEVLRQAYPDEMITYFAASSENSLTSRASTGIANPDQTSRIVPIGEGIVGKVAASRRSIKIDDIQANSADQPQFYEANSVLAVPVTFSDAMLGVLNLESKDLARFDENDQEFLTTVAVNLGSLISNINLVEQVRSQVNRQQQLFDITSKIRRSVDIETIMQTSVTEIAHSLNVRRASIQISPKLGQQSEKEQE